MKTRVYFDAAAAHPVTKAAQKAFLRALKAHGNPGAPHKEGQAASRILEEARTAIARETGAKPDAVIFTSGATESNALAMVGHIKARLMEGKEPRSLRVLYSTAQHASVQGAVEELRRMGVATEEVPLQGFDIDLEKLRKMLPGAALITLDAVCGETGARFQVQNVRRLINALAPSERPVLHVDATQAPLTENIERTRLGADLITFDAQKIGGVRGIGALIAPRGIPLLPLTEGGGQERGLRSGTPSPALARAFAVALSEARLKRRVFVKRAAKIRELLKKEIETIRDTTVNEGRDTAPNILNVSFMERDTDYLVALLDEAGFAVATKSACETDIEGSRAVLRFTGDARRAFSTLRISMHQNARRKDARRFTRALCEAVSFLDAS